MQTTVRFALAALLLVGSTTSCGGDDAPYKPAPDWSGRKPSLPAPPTLNSAPIKVGDAYTVAGAAHMLRSRYHDKDVTAKPITIQGYIVEENISSAPSCAIHKTGKADKEDCVAEIPSFWIADEKGAGKDKPRIRVMGWAKNFATVFDAMQKYDKMKEVKDPAKDLVKDEMWGSTVPFPLPNTGAKVKVTAKYGYTFAKSSTGLVSDPIMGVMTYEGDSKIEYIEPAPDKVAFKNKPGS
jgi:hypothetical protein